MYGESPSPTRCSMETLSRQMLPVRAGRFFLESRFLGAGFEQGLDLRELDAAGVQHDQEVIQHVGGFPDHAIAVLGGDRQHGLDGLLAEFLGALRGALIEELAGVGLLGRGGGAVDDALLQVSEGELAHGLEIASLPRGRESRHRDWSLYAPPCRVSMAGCQYPPSTSGSTSPRPTPPWPPAASGLWLPKPAARCDSGRSCWVRSSRPKAGIRRRSTSIRPRAATCGATW